MAIYVHTHDRITPEDVARYLTRCQQPRMAEAVRQLDRDAADLMRRYHDVLKDLTRLRHEIAPRAAISDAVSCRPGPMSDG